MDQDKQVVLQYFETYTQANIMRARLEEAGINCIMLGENTMLGGGGIDERLRIAVFAKDIEKAKEVYNTEYIVLMPPCPSCESDNVSAISTEIKQQNSGMRFALLTFLAMFLGFFAIILGLKNNHIQTKYNCNNCGNTYKDI